MARRDSRSDRCRWGYLGCAVGARVVHFLLLSALAGLPTTANAQTVFPPPAEPRRLAAARAYEPIRLDGLLEEAAWANAAVASGFVQAEPVQGDAASDPTDVRVLFDDD